MDSENTAADQSPDDDNFLDDIPIPSELIKHIPEEKREEFIREFVLYVEHIEEQYYAGPIPHPEIIASYEQIVPGSGDRILAMSEQQQRHKMKVQEILVNAATQHEKLGMWRGFILALAIIASGTLVILSGFSVAGFALVTGPAIAIAGVFLYDRHSSRSEPRTKPQDSEKPSSPPKLPDS